MAPHSDKQQAFGCANEFYIQSTKVTQHHVKVNSRTFF